MSPDDPGFPFGRRALAVEHATGDGRTAVHELAYVDEGSGPAVIMVHGNPTWGFTFRRLVAGLCDRHRVVVPDHVGMGRSSRPAPGTHPFTLASRIDDVTALIDHVAPRGTVDLVVHDWGGPIGLGWAVRNPERVGRVLACNTVAFPLPDGRPLPWQLRLARSRLGAALTTRLAAFNLATLAVGARRWPGWTAVRGHLAPYRRRADRRAVQAFVDDIPRSAADRAWAPLAATAAELHVLRDKPVVVCWGMRDPVFTPHLLAEWRRHLPDARIVELPWAGHLVLEDAADEVLAVARQLFDPAARPRGTGRARTVPAGDA